MSVYVELRCDEDGCGERASVRVTDELAGSPIYRAKDDGKAFTVDTGWHEWPDGWNVADDKVWCPEHSPPAAPPHDCEKELKARPDFSWGYETPPVFVCSCGKVWGVQGEESEGVSWVIVEGATVLPGGCRKAIEKAGLPLLAKEACGAPAVLVNKSPGGTETFLCERGHRVAIGK